MPRLFASIRALFGSQRPVANVRAEPAVDGQDSTAETRLPPELRLTDFKPEDIRATRMALDNLLRQVVSDLAENCADQDSLVKAYAAQTDDAGRRTLARQYQCVQSKGQQLEGRHEDLSKHLRMWDAVAMLVDKERWQEGKLNPASVPAVSMASLQSMMAKAIARADQSHQQLLELLDLVDMVDEKARLRRDFSLQTTMTALDEKVAQLREVSIAAQQSQLSGLADSVEAASLVRALGSRASRRETAGES
jgi:hypothetical protein